MHKSADAWKWPRSKTNFSIQETTFYALLTPQRLLAIEDSLYFKTFSTYMYIFERLLCVVVPSYASSFINTIVNHTYINNNR